MDWSKYGEWRHPKEWWQIKLTEWLKIKHPDKMKYDPKVDGVTEAHVTFGMKKHYGVLLVSKETILNDLK